MADSNALALRRLTVRRGGAAILRGIELAVEGGPPFAIVGESGSGKTTLLHAIVGLVPIDEGEASVFGRSIGGLPARERARLVGLVFQDHQLFPHLSARDNVLLAPRLAGTADAEAAAERLFADLGLAGLESRRPHELSGGQKQRVAIARCLVLRPRVLLLDEPSAALDPRTTRDLADLLSRLAGASQIVIVSHDRPFVELCCPRGARVEAGQVAAVGAPDALFHHP